jgi:hypothetical protein
VRLTGGAEVVDTAVELEEEELGEEELEEEELEDKEVGLGEGVGGASIISNGDWGKVGSA